MNCREFIEFLNDYFDDSLPDSEREVFDVHLGICPECRAYLQNYRRTVRLCRDARESVPSDVPEDLIKAILAAHQTT